MKTGRTSYGSPLLTMMDQEYHFALSSEPSCLFRMFRAEPTSYGNIARATPPLAHTMLQAQNLAIGVEL